MKQEIDNQYQLLLNKKSELIQFKSKAIDFKKEYESKSFLKKQFDLELNKKKTFYAFHGIEISDGMHKIKKKLRTDLKEYFFYANDNIDIRTICEENILMLDQAEIHVESINPNTRFNYGTNSQFIYFTGNITENCKIHISAIKEKGNRVLAFITEAYIDYEGTIWPDGEAEFKARNPAIGNDMPYSYSFIDNRVVAMHAGIFYVKKNEKKFIIYGDTVKGTQFPYKLMGFNMTISSIVKDRFYQNCLFLKNEFEKFKLQYPEVYI